MLNLQVLRWMPASFRARLEGDSSLVKMVRNTGWLFLDRLVRLGFGMVVGVWVARYLGPEQFGTFAYVQAVIALFLSFSTLGLDQIVVREVVKDLGDKARILGTTLALRLVGSLFALAASILVVVLSRPGDHLTHLLAAIMGSATIFQAFDTVDLWFQSQVQSKYSVLVKNSAFIVMALVKVGLILGGASLVAFAWATLGEAALGAYLLLTVYRWRQGDLGTWRADKDSATTLMRDGWPLIFSGLTVMVYMRIDQIMLGQLGGNKALGVFTAASRLSEVWYFVPVALVSTVMPGFVAAKQVSEMVYYEKLLKFFKLNVALALAIVLPVTLLSSRIVSFLYGSAYQGAGAILAVHIWGALFVFLGMAQHPWFIVENLTKRALARTLGGALVNIALNLILIPRIGGLGAAYASLAAQLSSNLLMNFFDRRTRPLFWILMRSFNLFTGWSPNVRN
jgi:PST family polysaccharide transporter